MFHELWEEGKREVSDPVLTYCEVKIYFLDWLDCPEDTKVRSKEVPTPIRQFIVNKALALKKECPVIHIELIGWANCGIRHGWTNRLVDQLCAEKIFVNSVHYKEPHVMNKLSYKIREIIHNIDEIDQGSLGELDDLFDRLELLKERYNELDKKYISPFTKFGLINEEAIKAMV